MKQCLHGNSALLLKSWNRDTSLWRLYIFLEDARWEQYRAVTLCYTPRGLSDRCHEPFCLRLLSRPRYTTQKNTALLRDESRNAWLGYKLRPVLGEAKTIKRPDILVKVLKRKCIVENCKWLYYIILQYFYLILTTVTQSKQPSTWRREDGTLFHDITLIVTQCSRGESSYGNPNESCEGDHM